MTNPNSTRVAHTLYGGDLLAHLDEQVLVERVRAGDPLAFEAIFRRYHEELCRVAEQVVGSRAAAEDVVQDVFLRVWNLRQRWNVTVSVQAYLRRAVRNVALRQNSRASARGHESLEHEADTGGFAAQGPALVDSGASPEQQAEAAALAEAMADAAAKLSPRAREVYTLSRDNGLSTKEIASRLGISPKTVEIYITRALTALRGVLRRWRDE